MASLELEARLDNLLSAQEETADIDLFAPITEREECPICMIPLPIDQSETTFEICCGKCICRGCSYKQTLTEMKNRVPDHEQKCAFCCQLDPKNHVKALKKLMKKNNTYAFLMMAERYKSGDGVFQSDTKSIEMYICAAELGNAQAYALIAHYYEAGNVVAKNMSRAFAFLHKAAKKGSLFAHQHLAIYEEKMNIQKSINHYKVAASAGYKDAMDRLMRFYKDKVLSKEDLTQTLRAYQASSDITKSNDREEARAFFKEHRT